ncbi:hypothetical protein [Erythrobacter litoralis]|uniref:Lipoprotein n=1 Tax=Erythrobacter litoralis (strain HTCC2594) TaxID=314225 RepID=Q2N797_ERYLH|nr:hypothetical protein [Erythrobacter litoralis]ABC64444.1 hypothetical protein ELI_11760 [Erythrobacter litoralis HTCC2594]
MQKLLVIAALSPLALLAACADDDAAESVDTEMADGAAGSAEVAEPVAPATPTPMADAGDYSGTYSVQRADGTRTSLTLNSENDSYSYTGSDGVERTGTVNRLDDGYRFSIDDYEGSIAYFALSNGSLIRLPDDVAIDNTVTVTGERYSRDNPPFSREPELGSPVVPDDMTNQ